MKRICIFANGPFSLNQFFYLLDADYFLSTFCLNHICLHDQNLLRISWNSELG